MAEISSAPVHFRRIRGWACLNCQPISKGFPDAQSPSPHDGLAGPVRRRHRRADRHQRPRPAQPAHKPMMVALADTPVTPRRMLRPADGGPPRLGPRHPRRDGGASRPDLPGHVCPRSRRTGLPGSQAVADTGASSRCLQAGKRPSWPSPAAMPINAPARNVPRIAACRRRWSA